MLDYRIKTFLTLCRTMNYTRTAELLNMTQPAVTQHIHYLEEEYGCKLFLYNGRTLKKTEKGIMLEKFSDSMLHNDRNIREAMKNEAKAVRLKIGATKTIGEYVIGDAILKYLSQGGRAVSLAVDNTETLLSLMERGELDMTLIEGYFDKSKYDYRLFAEVPFIGICAPGHKFAGKECSFEEIFKESIIVREKGSGTRDIFEKILSEHSFNLNCFSRVNEINNFAVIKKLVSAGMGISYVYETVIERDENISRFYLKDIPVLREFNFVRLKNSLDFKEFGEFEDILFS